MGEDARFVTIPQYPPFCWTELIVNAVAHRDYSILGTDIMVKIFDHHYVPYNKLYIRSQKRKWGNCSADKYISINWRIIKAPAFVIDYVITHELCHTIIMKHTVKFETLLNSHCPDCKQARIWLVKYGNSL